MQGVAKMDDSFVRPLFCARRRFRDLRSRVGMIGM